MMTMRGSRESVGGLIPVGQLITIVPESEGGRDRRNDPEGYASRVEDVLDGGVLVSMPMRQRRLVPLPLNSTVSTYFNRNGARYYFRAVVTAQQQFPFPLLRLAHVGDVRRQERRAHARVDVIIEPVQMMVVRDAPHASETVPSPVAVNIGAGGIGLVCRAPLPLGCLIHLELELPRNMGRLESEAEVVRCNAMEFGGVPKWEVGVRFQGISQRDRDRVASFVLYQQQLLRRRGLL